MKEIVCKICGKSFYGLISHLNHKHHITGKEYKEIYGDCKLICLDDDEKNKMSLLLKKVWENEELRKKASDVQKNGSSIFTKTYWINKGYTEEDAKNKVSEIQKRNVKKCFEKHDSREMSCLCKEFYLKRGKTEEEAIKTISEIQSKLSNRSSRFSGHIRTEESKVRISDSMKKRIEKVGTLKWAKHFGIFHGRSKSEIKFYNYIKENIDSSVEANVSVKCYIADVIKGKKIIEYYGDFWHANPEIFKKDEILECGTEKVYRRMAKDVWEKDNKRTSFLKENGYDVLVIWETDWKKRKEECIEKIKKYLYDL